MSTVNTSFLEIASTVDTDAAEMYFIKMITDPTVFANTCLNNEPVSPLQHQIDFMELAQQHRFLAVMNSRRVGITTAINWYMALWSFRTFDTDMVVISNDPASACDELVNTLESISGIPVPEMLVSKSTQYHRDLYFPQIHVTIRFMNGKGIESKLRGTTINNLIIDNVNLDQSVMQTIYPTLKKHTSVICCYGITESSLISDDLCTYKCFIPWTVMPYAVEGFREDTIAQIGQDRWDSEYGG